MKTTIKILFLSIISLSIYAQQYNSSNFGQWKTDKDNLPYFELNFRKQQCPWYPFPHFQGTGYNSVLTNQWGDVNLFTTEYGLANLSPALWSTRGGFYPMIEVNGELISLIISELDGQKLVKYGIGYTEYSGILTKSNLKLFVKYRISTPFDYSKGFFATVELTNLSKQTFSGTLSARSDVWPKPLFDDFKKWKDIVKHTDKKLGNGIASFLNINEHFKSITLSGPDDYVGSNLLNTLQLAKTMQLKSNAIETAEFYFSYNEVENAAKKNLQAFTSTNGNASWMRELKALQSIKNGNWMDRENTWTYSQLLSMCFYDKSLGEHFIHLGGYGIGENPATPGTGFSMREVAETAIVLSSFNPELAKSSLRWMAKTQLKSGDLKRGHFHFPLDIEDETQRLDRNFPDESDTEIWFLIACGEYYKATGDVSFFNEIVPFRTKNTSASVWGHIVAAVSFIQNDIGTGKNGLIKMLHGDWNDYLSRIGAEGNGQSVMNTAMMCRGLLQLIPIAEKIDVSKKDDLQLYLTTLQSAVTNCFDTDRFIRAYDDNGNSVGGHNDRLFINAQSWAALGKCGTSEQRKIALTKAVELCSTPIGMILMSKPYSSPTPSNISWAPIPAGEGENSGIWPQTVAWMIWALAEEGITDIALAEWKKNTLALHSERHRNVPFGIYNGTDCYSSHYANEREGWTQIEMFNRMLPIHMNPIIAWQAFGMKQILMNK